MEPTIIANATPDGMGSAIVINNYKRMIKENL
jgi:hypothetical protein